MKVARKLYTNCNKAYAQLIARIIVCFTSSISTNSTISTFLDSMGNQTRLSTTNIPLVWVPWSSTDACKIYFHWSLLCSLVTKKLHTAWRSIKLKVTFRFVDFKQHLSSIATAIQTWSQWLMYWSPKTLSDAKDASIAFINFVWGVSIIPRIFKRQF